MKIICIGDSNTYGYDPRDFFGMPYEMPWPQALSEMYGFDTVNLGENGAMIPYRKEFFAYLKRKLDHYSPFDLAIVMLGSNDILNSDRFESDTISLRMNNLLIFLKENYPSSGILLLAPPQMTREEKKKDTFRKELSELYGNIAEKQGVLFADTALWNLELSFDGVHLTEQDHVRFAEKTAEIIRKIKNN